MQTLVGFADEGAARRLIAYLNSQGIASQYQRADGPHAHCVLLADASRLADAQQIAKEYVAEPFAAKYQQAAWQAGDATTGAAAQNWLKLPSLQSLLHAPVCLLVLVICLLVFAFSWLGGFQLILDSLKIMPFAQLSDSGQWWRIVTPAFIHFSALHIVFNVLWWWMLGGQIERKLGSVTLLLLFAFTAITSNLLQLWISGPNFGGLSGVVYGVVGFVWWLGWLRPAWGLALPRAVVGFLLVWLLLGYADVLWVSMANTAHTVGLISGCLAAFVIHRLTPNRQGQAS